MLNFICIVLIWAVGIFYIVNYEFNPFSSKLRTDLDRFVLVGLLIFWPIALISLCCFLVSLGIREAIKDLINWYHKHK